MEIIIKDNDINSKTILEKTEKIISDACSEFSSDKKKFIVKLKSDKKILNLTINSFLLKQKLFGLTSEENDIFCILKTLK